MNVYAVNPTNLGFIKVWPANGAEPAVSTVNYQVGITAIATGALVPVDAGNSNRFTAKSPATVDFIADVVGYFKAPGDAAGLDIKVAGQRVMRYEFNAVSPNVIGGSPANSVTAGVRGATIAGGGVPAGNSDPDYADEAPNRVTDAYGTVGGGYANRAGNDAGTVIDRGFATVGGGGLNSASGTAVTIGGGIANAASGPYSTVGGGRLNVASGESATVGGGESNYSQRGPQYRAGWTAELGRRRLELCGRRPGEGQPRAVLRVGRKHYRGHDDRGRWRLRRLRTQSRATTSPAPLVPAVAKWAPATSAAISRVRERFRQL